MMRFGRFTATSAVVLGVGSSVLFRPAPRLIWNASASVPIGLYVVRPAGALHVDELLVVMPPEPLAKFLDERRYLPQGVLLLKHVLALAGQTVCRSDRTITVDGVPVGEALDRDHLRRPLAVWHGCRVIAGGDVFLMNRQSEDSLDSRYFGPLPTTTVVGRADPLWTDQEHRPCRNLASGDALRRNHLGSTLPFPVKPPAARTTAMPRRRRRLRSFHWLSVAAVLLIDGGIAGDEPVATEQQNVATAADPIAAVVAEASQRFGIPASWIRAVMQVESFGDVRALSRKGAMGQMQIMPESWATLRSRYGLGADPYDAHDNILAGAAYLRELLDRYGSPGFLGAYNAGPARYEDHLATGRALPAETQAYVATLAPVIGGGTIDEATVVNAVVRSWTEAPLFVVSAESSQTKPPASSNSHLGQNSTGSRAEDWTGLVPQSPGLFISMSRGNRQP